MMTETSSQDAPGQAAMAKFNDLFMLLEDLLKRIADTEDPNIRRLRAKVRAELMSLQTNVFGVEFIAIGAARFQALSIV